ncbi:MAG: hypothetical protein OIF35_03005, partial [Cellvibrionaceae bacterium]|nr:hypothetical protein [Cellvibrionaceae bacterium]
QTVDMVQRSLDTRIERIVVPTMVDRRTQACQHTVRALRNDYPINLWPGHIPVDTKLRDASRLGVPANLFQPAARGVQAYGSLYRYLEHYQPGAQPLLDHAYLAAEAEDNSSRAYWAEAV